MSVAESAAAATVRAPSLETIGMTKIFGSLVALEDVSIKVEPGSFHALLGENGAGKSTLVKCIMGYYHATEGAILVGGRQRRHQGEVLIDHADAKRLRVARVAHAHRAPVEQQLAALGHVKSHDAFDQSRFARAVLAEQRVKRPGWYLD